MHSHSTADALLQWVAHEPLTGGVSVGSRKRPPSPSAPVNVKLKPSSCKMKHHNKSRQHSVARTTQLVLYNNSSAWSRTRPAMLEATATSMLSSNAACS